MKDFINEHYHIIVHTALLIALSVAMLLGGDLATASITALAAAMNGLAYYMGFIRGHGRATDEAIGVLTEEIEKKSKWQKEITQKIERLNDTKRIDAPSVGKEWLN